MGQNESINLKHRSGDERRVWAGGLLYNPHAASLLLHHRDKNTAHNPDRWALFGGLCRVDEQPLQCFIRELEEEIGLRVTAAEVIPLYTHLREDLNTLRHVFFVPSTVETASLRLGEGAGFEWIPVNELDQYDITEQSRKDIGRFLATIRQWRIAA